MLIKAPSDVLASQRGSAYHSSTRRLVACYGLAGESFEHPAIWMDVKPPMQPHGFLRKKYVGEEPAKIRRANGCATPERFRR